jgi:uncharacterized membrane protein YbhN (UPF0104 family)
VAAHPQRRSRDATAAGPFVEPVPGAAAGRPVVEPVPGAAAGADRSSPARTRPSRRRRLLRAGLVVLAIVFVVLALRGQTDEIADALRRLSVGTIVLAFLAVVAGLLAASLSWRAMLTGLGSPLPLAVGGRVYLLAQLGKYLPGSLWPVLAQTELGREHDVPRARSAAAAMAVLMVSLVTGTIVGVGCLALSATDAVRTYWYVAAVPLLGVVLLSPPVLSRLLRLAFRVTRRPVADVAVSGSALLVSAAWGFLQWICFGLQIWLLARGLGGGHDRLLLLAVGAFALAWVVGFLVVFVPAGAGAREAVLLLVLGPTLGSANALALALVSRVLMIVGDFAVVGLAVLSARVHARRAAARTTPAA